MIYKTLDKQRTKTLSLIVLIFALLLSCGEENKKENNGTSENEVEEICEEVKKAECPDEGDDGEWDSVESCDVSDEDCRVITEGEGQCQTSVICEYSYDACNNSDGYVNCPEGYEASKYEEECTVGVGSCIMVPAGFCSDQGTCDCQTCGEGYLMVPNCGGRTDCSTIRSCANEISCAPCKSECTNDENVVSSCDTNDDSCRELTCAEDPTLKYFCKVFR